MTSLKHLVSPGTHNPPEGVGEGLLKIHGDAVDIVPRERGHVVDDDGEESPESLFVVGGCFSIQPDSVAWNVYVIDIKWVCPTTTPQ